MIFLTRAVTRAARRPLVIGDLPFGTYEVSDEQAVANAIRLVKEGGADVVKLEGAGRMVSRVRAIAESNIGVMGHVGLTPQSATKLGGFRAQGRTADAALKLHDDALALAGRRRFAIVLEAVPAPVATAITEALEIPTIGIGAGAGCDGQVLVWHDLLGHVRRPYAALRQALRRARRRDRRGARRATSPTCAAARSPRSSTPTRSRTTSSSAFEAALSSERRVARRSGSDRNGSRGVRAPAHDPAVHGAHADTSSTADQRDEGDSIDPGERARPASGRRARLTGAAPAGDRRANASTWRARRYDPCEPSARAGAVEHGAEEPVGGGRP